MDEIDQIMERASERLAAMRYLDCEALCRRALDLAREREDFDRYARILLPLQEARRQRRQIAVDAGVTVLAGPERSSAEQILDAHRQGCLLLIAPPYSEADERAVRELAAERELYVEVLVLEPRRLRGMFEREMEEEGDEAIASIGRDLTPVEKLDALAAVVHRVGDHEIAHQRLADAAREAARAKVEARKSE